MTTRPAEGRDGGGSPERRGEPREGAAVAKRSLTVAGHRTSISLEDAFWDGLREVAAARGTAVAGLVAEIDRGRGAANLSSAIRVFVLKHLRGATAG